MSDARRLTGEEIGAFSNALCAAFDLASLEIMLRTRLNRRLDTVAGQGSLREVAFKTVEVAIRESWERQLISAARAANPGNPELRRFCQEYPHLVDSPPSPPEDGEPDPEKEPVHSWFRRHWPVMAVVVLILAGASIWAIDRWTGPPQDTQAAKDSSDEKSDGKKGSKGSSTGPRRTGPIRDDDGEDRQLIINAFRALTVKEPADDRTIRLGLWIIGEPYYQDLETIHGLARSLRTGDARVVAAGAEDKRLRAVMIASGFRKVHTEDGRAMLDDKIDAVVFIGVFREQLRPTKDSKRNQVSPIVDACDAGKHVFVVLDVEDNAKWPRYLGKSAAANSRYAMDAAKKNKTMLYATIPGKDDFKEDFASFFDAIRSGNPKLRGSVELLP